MKHFGRDYLYGLPNINYKKNCENAIVMSDVVDDYNFGFSSHDRYTIFLVNGYMKDPASSYHSHLIYFPQDIILITIDYIGDHFMMYRGSYQWQIDNELLQKMCDADNMDEFQSDSFEMVNLKWKFFAYPNGNEAISEGCFNLFLQLNTIQPEWDQLHFNFASWYDAKKYMHK